MTVRPEPADETNEEIVRQALAITGRGPGLKSKVQEAVEYVQLMKRTEKSRWSYSLRYGVLTKRQRDAATKIATALHSLKMALKPLATDKSLQRRLKLITDAGDSIDFPMDSAALEKWHRHFRRISDMKVRAGSRFDARKLLAAQQAAILLEAAGRPLTRSRDSEFGRLAAILYGEPHADFAGYLSRFAQLRTARLRAKANG